MSKRKRKLSAAEKRARRKRRAEFMTIFVHGKQRRIRRPPTIDGLDVDEFIRRNAESDLASPEWAMGLHDRGECALKLPTGRLIASVAAHCVKVTQKA